MSRVTDVRVFVLQVTNHVESKRMKLAFQIHGKVVVADVFPGWQLARSGRPVIEDEAEMPQGIGPETERCIAILHDASHVRLANPYSTLSTCLKGVLISGGRAQCDAAACSPCLERR
eukprot:2761443-Rhodomonas_salina.1